MKTRYYAAAALMIAALLGFFAYVLPDLPARVPVHWNLHGEADGFGSPWALLAVGPGAMAATLALFALMPWLSPKRFEVDAFQRTYLNLMLIVVALLGYVFVLALWSGWKGPLDMTRAMIGGLCLMAILIGNLLGKVRRNFFIGIRTPWTLASERVWYATHRLAARVTVAAGVLALAALWLGAPPWIAFTLVMAAFVLPAVYSLFLYKRLQGLGKLGSP